MRPLNHADYLMIGIVLLAVFAGLCAILAIALKLAEELRERRANPAFPNATKPRRPSRPLNAAGHEPPASPPTSTYEPNRRSTAASIAPGERP